MNRTLKTIIEIIALIMCCVLIIGLISSVGSKDIVDKIKNVITPDETTGTIQINADGTYNKSQLDYTGTYKYFDSNSTTLHGMYYGIKINGLKASKCYHVILSLKASGDLTQYKPGYMVYGSNNTVTDYKYWLSYSNGIWTGNGHYSENTMYIDVIAESNSGGELEIYLIQPDGYSTDAATCNSAIASMISKTEFTISESTYTKTLGTSVLGIPETVG